ncbi:hypothetical protein L798_13074 [Zootermopsis nevadensis]|uniref:Uncharacterized protein n=1 Tax=Zootermopsis nevadensis TaxID=136037 RepID=A0A067RGB6_ZOONE|nr:hypothetical protein L798_06776 [Zootermopsis nevadensis]KDR22822.1 hypothetical protein L798_13074 [Zootermopsis nevadensis]
MSPVWCHWSNLMRLYFWSLCSTEGEFGKHISNMFASLKSKIKEETGSDPTKLALSNPPQNIIQRAPFKTRFWLQFG